jgi:hypothetical protein
MNPTPCRIESNFYSWTMVAMDQQSTEQQQQQQHLHLGTPAMKRNQVCIDHASMTIDECIPILANHTTSQVRVVGPVHIFERVPSALNRDCCRVVLSPGINLGK